MIRISITLYTIKIAIILKIAPINTILDVDHGIMELKTQKVEKAFFLIKF